MTRTITNQAKRSSSWASMALAAMSALSLLFVAGATQAGVVLPVTQLHAFKVGGTIFGQGVNERTGDNVLDKDKFKEKDLGANCLMQEKLDRGQSIFLVMFDACGDLNDNEIQIISESPPSTTTVGGIDFDVNSLIVNQKRGIDNTLTLPASVNLACIGTDDVDVAASAVAAVKLDSEGLCVESIKLKNGSGTGTIGGISVILDGVKADAKKPAQSAR